MHCLSCITADVSRVRSVHTHVLTTIRVSSPCIQIHCAAGYWAGIELDLPHGQVRHTKGSSIKYYGLGSVQQLRTLGKENDTYDSTRSFCQGHGGRVYAAKLGGERVLGLEGCIG